MDVDEEGEDGEKEDEKKAQNSREMTRVKRPLVRCPTRCCLCINRADIILPFPCSRAQVVDSSSDDEDEAKTIAVKKAKMMVRDS